MAILATLVDKGATLHDGTRGLRQREHNVLQAVPGEAEKANFILASGAQPPDFEPAIGSLESPETGATLILTVAALGQGEMHMSCTGPGIKDRHTFHVQDLHPGWIQARKKWNTWFPLGVDMYLVDATQVCALPRTTCTA
jgi:alpha-D-ribose 1-methylphosphonate 5-triphosphate synthase subunit PhnH